MLPVLLRPDHLDLTHGRLTTTRRVATRTPRSASADVDVVRLVHEIGPGLMMPYGPGMITDSLTVDRATFEQRTGWQLKPDCGCKGAVCIPLAAPVEGRHDRPRDTRSPARTSARQRTEHRRLVGRSRVDQRSNPDHR